MTTLYRMTTNIPGGEDFRESHELEPLQEYRTNNGKTAVEWPITAYNMTFTISNDPESRVLDDIDEAQTLCYQLQQDTFSVAYDKTLLNPQPEGLNG